MEKIRYQIDLNLIPLLRKLCNFFLFHLILSSVRLQCAIIEGAAGNDINIVVLNEPSHATLISEYNDVANFGSDINIFIFRCVF
jgi:hypothetical protein